MQNNWDDEAAGSLTSPLEECVYGSRLLGSVPRLVLHGGGNTSVKAPFADICGDSINALYVKGSGWDLGTIETAGFAPLPVDRMGALLGLDALSDEQMMRELSAARLDPTAPQPSVESLLHAFLPHPAVQHSHADAIVTLTNTANGRELITDVYGDSVVTIPYVMPGFDLAKVASEQWAADARDHTVGMVLLNHGLFTFGESTKEAYVRHIELITRAEAWLERYGPGPDRRMEALTFDGAIAMAGLRCSICAAASTPMVMTADRSPQVGRFVGRPDLASLAGRGPLTPDHVIRTKRLPLVGRDVDAYARDYRQYYGRNATQRPDLTMLDPAPRVVLDAELGMLGVGPTAAAAAISSDIYRHTIDVVETAEDHLGGYVALAESDIFDVEYWELEQAKLRLAGGPAELGGTVALVTGAASGIGRACAEALLASGVAVAGLDLDPSIIDTFDHPAWCGLAVDVTDAAAQRQAIVDVVERFGGIDHVIVGAGIFGQTHGIDGLSLDDWQRVQAVNVDSVVALFSDVAPILRSSPVGGQVVVIGSKNVTAPGKGAAAYSSSKAALNQLARVAALEWAEDGIRVNSVHPDGVFDTALWTEELVAERASHYDMTVAEYKHRNLLGVEVTSALVADAVTALCGDTFAATTGAEIPIDGGSDRVI